MLVILITTLFGEPLSASNIWVIADEGGPNQHWCAATELGSSRASTGTGYYNSSGFAITSVTGGVHEFEVIISIPSGVFPTGPGWREFYIYSLGPATPADCESGVLVSGEDCPEVKVKSVVGSTSAWPTVARVDDHLIRLDFSEAMVPSPGAFDFEITLEVDSCLPRSNSPRGNPPDPGYLVQLLDRQKSNLPDTW